MRRKQTRLEPWEEHLKDPIKALDKALKYLENQYQSWLFARNFSCVNGLWPRGLRHGAKDLGKAVLGRNLALLGPVGQRALAHSVHLLERSREVWPHGELFLPYKKEPVVASNEVLPNPFVSAETLKACALIGLHLLAAGREAGSSACQSSDVGDMWRHGCPMSPEWASSCSASDTSCGGEEYEHNNECRAIEVMGQGWSSEVVALFLEWH